MKKREIIDVTTERWTVTPQIAGCVASIRTVSGTPVCFPSAPSSEQKRKVAEHIVALHNAALDASAPGPGGACAPGSDRSGSQHSPPSAPSAASAVNSSGGGA